MTECTYDGDAPWDSLCPVCGKPLSGLVDADGNPRMPAQVRSEKSKKQLPFGSGTSAAMGDRRSTRSPEASEKALATRRARHKTPEQRKSKRREWNRWQPGARPPRVPRVRPSADKDVA